LVVRTDLSAVLAAAVRAFFFWLGAGSVVFFLQNDTVANFVAIL
jgi:hypothetical protein